MMNIPTAMLLARQDVARRQENGFLEIEGIVCDMRPEQNKAGWQNRWTRAFRITHAAKGFARKYS
jgi:hypothetical protein